VHDHATQWCALTLLPYFDLCRMVIIDPMHNLFLGALGSICWTAFDTDKTDHCSGLVKTHFYQIWVKLKVLRKMKELRTFHGILADVSPIFALSRFGLKHFSCVSLPV
jgi:hypothetical protein